MSPSDNTSNADVKMSFHSPVRIEEPSAKPSFGVGFGFCLWEVGTTRWCSKSISKL